MSNRQGKAALINEIEQIIKKDPGDVKIFHDGRRTLNGLSITELKDLRRDLKEQYK